MTSHSFTLYETRCQALPSGALHLPDHNTLCVSDLHLGKSDRIARRGGTMLPPYEVQATLEKLQSDINATNPTTLICLGDSFDDLTAAQSLSDEMQTWLTRLQAGRRWIWIEGNHDPGPVDLGGSHLVQITVGTLAFRHIATSQKAEVSGHYHPKYQIAGRSRPAFVYDASRLILPAYGAYTGGLSANHPDLRSLFGPQPIAVLTGTKAISVPVTNTRRSPRFPGKFG
jgi:DNA ligase-associated metallophosphoesterase